MDLLNLKRKVAQYKDVLTNTEQYRQSWKDHLQQLIVSNLEQIAKDVELDANIILRDATENLCAIAFSLGEVKSGLAQQVGESGIERPLIKHNGALIYQQLFNGKILVMLQYPSIEGYGEPRPPRQLAIYRPEELTSPFFIRHIEELMREVTAWEDYDDDEPSDQRIGFKMNFDAA